VGLSHRSFYVELNGDQDIGRRDALHSALPETTAGDSIVIDCRNVFYMDSVAMGVLARYRGRFVEAGGDAGDIMMIAPAGSSVRRLLDIAGLGNVFKLIEHLPADEAESIRS
jgi:anti-anti-sigma factor